MSESKVKPQKLYPSLALLSFAKELCICNHNVYEAIELLTNKDMDEETFGEDLTANLVSAETIAKRVQRNQNLNLTAEGFWKVLDKAVDLRIEEIKSMSTRKNFSSEEEVAILKKTRVEKEEKIKKKIKILCFLEKKPFFNNNKIPAKEINHAIDYGKALFVDILSPQESYILAQNADAFKGIVQDIELYHFCDFVTKLDEKSKNRLREMNIVLSGTLSTVVASLNKELFKDWLGIYSGYYEKTVKAEIQHYKKDISDKNPNISDFNEEEKKDLDDMAKQFFVKKYWEKFQKQMRDDFAKNPVNPLTMIALTDILNDVDLLLAYLCCDSNGRELLLAKAQKLSELKKNATPQTSD